MSGLIKVISFVALFAMIASTAACDTASVQPLLTAATSSHGNASLTPSASLKTPIAVVSPSPAQATTIPLQTVEPSTPEPTKTADNSGDDGDQEDAPPHYDIADLAKLGISDAQYQKIDALLYGFLNMNDDNYRENHYFTNTASILKQDQLSFAYRILNEKYDAIGMDALSEGTIKSDVVVNIIRSAFNNHYKPSPRDNCDELLVYKNGNFQFEGASGDPVKIASTYSITRISSNRLLLKFNVFKCSDPGNFYENKAEAIIQNDSSSLFGYHLVSVSKGKETQFKFSSAYASHSLPAVGKKTFNPGSALDKKFNTAWATQNGKGEWIQFNFNKPQSLTGISLYFGDWSDDSESAIESNQPSRFRLDFSDGTSIIVSDENGELNYPCVTFGRLIKTTYVRITLLDMYTNTTAYLSEVSPF